MPSNPYDNERNRALAFAQVNALRKGLGDQNWSELVQTRKQYEGDPIAQQAIAPAEHRAFAREYVAENPLSAPALALAAPAYYAAKKLGLASGRTAADVDQVIAGWQGTLEGLMQYFQGAQK